MTVRSDTTIKTSEPIDYLQWIFGERWNRWRINSNNGSQYISAKNSYGCQAVYREQDNDDHKKTTEDSEQNMMHGIDGLLRMLNSGERCAHAFQATNAALGMRKYSLEK